MRVTLLILAVRNLRITPSKMFTGIILIWVRSVAGLGHLEEEQQQEDRASGGDKRSAHRSPPRNWRLGALPFRLSWAKWPRSRETMLRKQRLRLKQADQSRFSSTLANRPYGHQSHGRRTANRTVGLGPGQSHPYIAK
jgi:hypothetical protein